MLSAAGRGGALITCEENVKRGGFGEAVADMILGSGFKGKFLNLSLPDEFLSHGSPNDIRDHISFDPNSLYNKICDFLQ